MDWVLVGCFDPWWVAQWLDLTFTIFIVNEKFWASVFQLKRHIINKVCHKVILSQDKFAIKLISILFDLFLKLCCTCSNFKTKGIQMEARLYVILVWMACETRLWLVLFYYLFAYILVLVFILIISCAISDSQIWYWRTQQLPCEHLSSFV
jgi:hypothetical protein